MAKQPKPLMIVHPDAATPDVLETLRAAGYAAVVTDKPEAFREVSVLPVVARDAVTRAALATIRHSVSTSVRADFASRLLTGLEAHHG